MLKRLIKLANKLDSMGYHDEAGELDEICREAAKWVDKRPESERRIDRTGPEHFNEMGFNDLYDPGSPRVEKELKPRPGEGDPRRWLIDEEGTHEEDRSEPTPDEKLNKEFPGQKENIDPDELSEEDLPESYKVERGDETFSMDLDPDEDKLVELMENMPGPSDDADDSHQEGCDCNDCGCGRTSKHADDDALDGCDGEEDEASGEAPMALQLGQLFN